MPRLIRSERGNGIRPSDPRYVADDSRTDGERRFLAVLDVSEETHERIGQRHDAARDENDDSTWPLLGHVVIIDNPRPVGAPSAGCPMHYAAANSTLHEAATEVIGAFEDQALDMPEWVGSSDEELAEVLAEHFSLGTYNTCEVISFEEADRRYGEARQLYEGLAVSEDVPDGEDVRDTEEPQL